MKFSTSTISAFRSFILLLSFITWGSYQACASYVYTDVQPDAVVNGQTSYEIDMDQDGSLDFQIYNYYYSSIKTTYIDLASLTAGGQVIYSTLDHRIYTLSSYETVCPGSVQWIDPDTEHLSTLDCSSGVCIQGGPIRSTRTVIGVRWLADNGIDYYYGWIGISINNTNSSFGGNQFTIYDFGCQTLPNTCCGAGYIPSGPSSNFVVDKTTTDLNQPVTYTANTAGTITSYAWDFGPGATPATANTVGPHTVTYSTSGAKTVTLTVNGNVVKTQALVTVSNVNLTADFTASPTNPAVNQSILFTASTTGSVTSYLWDFGAGASTATATTVGPHSIKYTTSGLKTVTLTVNGTVVKTKTDYINVGSTAVTADFTASNTSPSVNQIITFTGSTTGTITSYLWNFGAGASPASATTAGPHNVQYSTSGTKTVTLTVNGTVVNTKTNYINVGTTAVTADFTASNTTPTVNQTITFTGSTTGSITSYLWNFGAGASPATATTAGPHSVQYSTTGAKTITLTVNGTVVKTKTNYINVAAPLPAVYTDNFTNTSPINFYPASGGYAFSMASTGSAMQITGDGTAGKYNYISYVLYDNNEMGGTYNSPFNVNNSGTKKLYIKAKSSVANTSLSIFLQDANGNATNGVDQSFTITSSYPSSAYVIDFSGNLEDWYDAGCSPGAPCPVDFTNIDRLVIGINAPTGGFNGTVSIDYITLGADIQNVSTGINSSQDVNSFIVYPNPASGYVFIEGVDALSTVEILNPMGQAITSVSSTNQIDCSVLTSGMYYIKVTNAVGLSSVKPLVIR